MLVDFSGKWRENATENHKCPTAHNLPIEIFSFLPEKVNKSVR